MGKRISGSLIVGVVGDVHGRSLDTEIEELVYDPMLDSVGGGVSAMKMVVRSDRDPVAILPDVREVVAQLDPDLPISDVSAMSEILANSMNRTTFTMTMIVLAAAIAIFLACVGPYGIMAYSLSQRTAEIRMRLALGAEPSHVFRIMRWRGMKLPGLGIAVGLARAFGLDRVLNSLLYGVGALDPAVLVGGPALVLVVAGPASWLPARRAARVAPCEAFRGRR